MYHFRILKISGKYERGTVSKESCAGYPELTSCCVHILPVFADRYASFWGLSLITEVTNNQPVFNKNITAQTVAICRPDFRRDIRPSPCAKQCSGRILCQLVILKRRTQLTNALPNVFV
jgi:hypothetical protein